MAKVILVTGGARSGKSAYSETLAKNFPAPRVYIATAPVMDEEMRRRVVRHQQQRKNDGWDTVEEEIDLAGAVEKARACGTILVDCLTLWINNLLYAAEQQGREITEDEMLAKCARLEKACAGFDGNIIFVINEVGMGIVPDNPLARRFRDLSGRCSQRIAEFADRVVLVACGLPLVLKTETQLK
ncbi:MAG: bifunctional adenosylcobinamide kinase/adenosylcobinamide-phosphate guanylyltransferase [Victivallaceae bacterium]|nr:bifunctional adenosylcobinamide kinase/adenosylcobinamide-phosphate guanylyltransferase [Victivallaceae bacterium]